MTLSANEKTLLSEAAKLAIELDEPEAFIEAFRRAASRKADERHISDTERVRWRRVAEALGGALYGIEARSRRDALEGAMEANGQSKPPASQAEAEPEPPSETPLEAPQEAKEAQEQAKADSSAS